MITPNDLAVISMALARMLDQEARRKRDRAIELGDAGKAKLCGDLAADVAGVQAKVFAIAGGRALSGNRGGCTLPAPQRDRGLVAN